MSYVQGGLIEAVDFNTFRSQLQNVYGVGNGNAGYGQTSINVPAVAGGFVEVVKSLEWLNLRNALAVCDNHQQNSVNALVPLSSDLQPGDEITAHDGITDPANFPQMLTNITNSRLTAGALSTTLFMGRSSQTITNTWTNTAFTIVDLEFPDADSVRYFFNSGGEIIVRASFTPSSPTAQNLAWQNVLASSGSIVMNHNTTTNPGGTVGTASPEGYYTLSNSNPLQLMFTASPPSGSGYYYYGVNTFQVLGRTLGSSGANGGNGTTVRLRIDLDDNFAGGSDLVDGTLTIDIDERRATTYLTVPSFVVNVQTPLNAS